MLGMKFSLKMNPTSVVMTQRGLEERGRVQQYIDNEVLKRSEPYTPLETGTLSKSGQLNTVLGSGEVIWSTPYARYQYYGKVMAGSAPKKVTDKALKYHGGGARGEKWFERMKAAHKDGILSGAAKIAGGKAN